MAFMIVLSFNNLNINHLFSKFEVAS